MSNSDKLVKAPASADDESGPRAVDEEARERDREVLRTLTENLPRRQITTRERAIFDEHKARVANGEPLLTQEEWVARRTAK